MATLPFPISPPRVADLEGSLSPQDAEALLKRLIQHGWHRLAPEYDDPLNMLFDTPAREWTMGWDPEDADATLYLIAWEKTDWSTQRRWTLTINGVESFTCPDTQFSAHAAMFRTLLESKQLPFQSGLQFLKRFSDYSIPLEQREHALSLLSKTLIENPELWNSLKRPFYQCLGQHLSDDSWPTLDLLKIHRLDHKIVLLQGLKAWVKAGLIDDADEKRMLNRLINQLHLAYERLGPMLSNLAIPTYNRSYTAFHSAIANGFWRAQLMNRRPVTTG